MGTFRKHKFAPAKITLAITVLLLTVVINKTRAYVIHGCITGLSAKWDNKIYLAAIRSVNDFQSASEDFKINVAEISNNGEFRMVGNNLPNEYLFYRIYLSNNSGTSMQLITGKDQNFIHLILNNNSGVTVNADLTKQPFYDAEIKGSQWNLGFESFYKDIYYINRQNFYSPYTRVHLNDVKTVELIKNTIHKYNNPYYTIFALSHLNWSNEYLSNSAFIKKEIDELEMQLPDNIYVSQLEDKLQLFDFQTSTFRNYLNLKYFSLLVVLCLLQFALILFLFIYFKRTNAVISRQLIPAERLTQKEMEIANLVIQGKSNKEISALLFIEVSTVKSHVSSIYQKLSISGRKELVNKLTIS